MANVLLFRSVQFILVEFSLSVLVQRCVWVTWMPWLPQTSPPPFSKFPPQVSRGHKTFKIFTLRWLIRWVVSPASSSPALPCPSAHLLKASKAKKYKKKKENKNQKTKSFRRSLPVLISVWQSEWMTWSSSFAHSSFILFLFWVEKAVPVAKLGLSVVFCQTAVMNASS